MKYFVTCISVLLVLSKSIHAEPIKAENWTYIPIDDARQKWGDWDKPEWLRYFGLDFGDVDQNGDIDIVSGRYIYHNPGGSMEEQWRRTALDDNVDAIFVIDADGDRFADIIAQALPHIYWYEAIDKEGTSYARKRIATIPPTSHVNSQGFEKAQILHGGKLELVIASDGNIYCITIPENSDTTGLWPTHLIAKNTSDEGIGIGDIDEDGDLDIACGRRPEGEGEPLILVWFENPGSITMPWKDHIVGRTEKPIDRVELGDLNGDGNLEIVISQERYPGLEPDGKLLWFSRKDNIHQVWEKHVIVTQYSMNNLDVADIDKDGDIDIITNEHKGPRLETQLWINNGKASFTKHVLDRGKENHLGTQFIDLDGDGDLDVAGCAWDHYQWMHVWRNDEIRKVAGANFRITDFGAVADDNKLDTDAIQAAIDRAATDGGTVTIPKGTFDSGAIHLKNRITLNLEEGAILKGSNDHRDYGPGRWLVALVTGENLDNIRITGKGTIDGSDCKNPKGEEGFRGPHGILLKNCSNITIEGITIRRTGNYAILCRDSEKAVISKVSIQGGHDGLHAQACRDFRVNHCDVRTGDDCFAGCDNQNFEITDCKINSSCNGFRLGCLDLKVKRCRIWGPGEYQHQVSNRKNMLSAFVHFAPRDRNPKLPSDKWQIEDLIIDNVGFVYGYDIDRGLWQKGQPAKRLYFRNIEATEVEKPIHVIGDSKKQFELTLENVQISLREDCRDQPILNVSIFGLLKLNNVVFKNNGKKPVIIAKDGLKVNLQDVKCVPKNTSPFTLEQIMKIE